MVQQISTIELKHRLQSGRPIRLIDVMSPESYAGFHLPQAKNIPWDEDFEKNVLRSCPTKKETIVVYGDDEKSEASSLAAAQLEDLGYADVYDYRFGREGWKAAAPVAQSANF